ncbi:2-oxo-tetronate isomerase [Chloroflexota bacterium]
MPRFSVNLTMLFNEVEFLSRFELAAKAGFKAVEFMFPYDYKEEAILEKLGKFDLRVVLHNLPGGDISKGDWGIACLPDRLSEFQESVGLAIRYAKALKCNILNCMNGIVPKGVPMGKVTRTYIDNLRFAAEATGKAGIQLVIEPLNVIDRPSTYLTSTRQAKEVIKEVNHSNLAILYDIYHMQIMEGNLTDTIRDNIDYIKHIHMADVPGRHEPGTGEINFPNLIKFIDAAGYRGWIGVECKPTTRTEDGFAWFKIYLNA